ncbi:hypothetical protein P3X46_014217 [Hevea brasiliensis]|uniref:TF-B3 domain-containing protein n=1 Tax=Hevea brasiliensis TaxID=3981 RepID=A0ABQ9M8E4_HEVBR|nr:B3 domain-containing transcription factor VRN1 [Hevea brasiliensis]KAJ9175685.1 hypothetical protein P3X46_014217 [Hevea brasiliensis]
MSSQGLQLKGRDDNFNLTAKIPQFFKIILQSTALEGRLRIPIKFVKKYGNCLSSPMILEIPTGNTWQVELLKNGDDVWLEKGWQEFSEYHSLKHGHLLLFKYEGECNFSVLIFDMSAVEIEYPGRDIHSGKETKKQENVGDLKSKAQNYGSKGNQSTPIQIEDSDYAVEIECPGRDIHSGRDTKKQENEEDLKSKALNNGSTSNQSTPIQIEDSDCSTQEFRVKSNESRSEKSVGKQAGRPSSSNVSTALEAANKFTSSYPYLKVIMDAYRKGPLYLRIPITFIREHMKCETHTVGLKVAEKTWLVNLYVSKRSGQLCGGWPVFVRENCLKKGDICIFELVGRRMMNVHIFRRPCGA